MTAGARITAGELVLVCSHYDLGRIESVRKFRAGSRRSAKVLLISRGGQEAHDGTGRPSVFLLKRHTPLTPGRSAELAFRVASSHQIMLHLASRGFPVTGLVGTRTDNNSMLQLGGHVYEVFRFVPGRAYARTDAEAAESGALLARFHLLLHDFEARWTLLPRGDYHDSPGIRECIAALPARLDPRYATTIAALRELYDRSAAQAAPFAPAFGPEQFIHGDWHPGNMVFRIRRASDAPGANQHIAAVLDFDTARPGRPLIDFAAGALQFAIARKVGFSRTAAAEPTTAQPDRWSIEFDQPLFAAFCAGYKRTAAGTFLAGLGWRSTPWLMLEALIAEAAVPIAATGKMGRIAGGPFLRLVAAQAAKLAEQCETLARHAESL